MQTINGIYSRRHTLKYIFIILYILSVYMPISESDDWDTCKFQCKGSGSRLDAVYLSNEICASLPPCENIIRLNTELDTIETEYTASLNITITANTSGSVGPGDHIGYEIMVCNTGDVNITNIKVRDDLLECSPFTIPGTLVPGQCENVSDLLIYSVTEGDLCNGSIENVARATAEDCYGKTITASVSSPMILTEFDASFEINKTANVSVATLGDVIGYTIFINNTGNVMIYGLRLEDDITREIWNVSPPPLAPGENKTLHTSYTVKESDLGSQITNTLFATGYVGPCGPVDNVRESASATVSTEYTADLTVTKTADYGPCPDNPAGLETNITYKINVTNTGDVNLSNVRITDPMLSLDEYLLTGLLEPGESVEGTFHHVVNESELCEPINNTVEANATVQFTVPESASNFDQEIEYVNDTDKTCVPAIYNASLNITKTANRTEASLGDVIGYEIVVTNTGNVNITDVEITDSIAEPGYWSELILAPGANKTVYATYTVNEDDVENGSINNTAKAVGQGPCGPVDPAVDSEIVKVISLAEFEVRKVALQKTAKRGEAIEYLIQIKTDFPVLHNVVVRDVFNKRVEFVSASPKPDADGIWRLDKVIVGSLAQDANDPEWRTLIVLKVKVPEAQDFEFGMDQGVAGEGFVNVKNDYSTTYQSYVITNCIYVTTEETGGTVYSDCESVTVSYDPGTVLSTHEHGSGIYESAEVVRMRTENKSISMEKDMAATYASTTLGLYNNRTVAYSSRWTEGASAKNRVTGATMSEHYRYATSIDRESRMFLDKNESVMDINTEFDGMGHVGFLKMPTSTSTPQTTPLFESREDYTGSFKVLERVDEYGSSVSSEKSTSGVGLAAVDKRVTDSQRSYESGTGTYDSEEIIETNTNYIAKDIILVHSPMSQSLTHAVSINASMKWKEGMYSKTPGTSYIGEEYTGVTELDKETVAFGLNEMDTEAEFSGRARYRAVLRDEVDFDEQYEGDYSVQKRILFTGVPKYDRPHLNVTKTLDGIEEETIPWGYNETHLAGEIKKRKVATYTITIENDGDRALIPVYVRDIFPPGPKYINASKRPSELTDAYANWTLTHLSIGDVETITLNLDVTKYYPDELVNKVEVCGGYDEEDEWVCAYNFSALEIDWLTCCIERSEEQISTVTTAELDQENQSVVRYKVEIRNWGDVTRVATVTDSLPVGVVLLDSMVPFASYDGSVVVWNLVEIGPSETKTIEFSALAPGSGRFTNTVQVDPRSIDGPVVQPVRATCVIDVGVVEGDSGPVSCDAWQPPNWEFEHRGYEPDETTCEQLTYTDCSCDGTDSYLAP